MDKPKIAVAGGVDDLGGLPALGAARRAALAVAGITTRAELAKATVEQFISITGIQRTYAIKILDVVQKATALVSVASSPLTDEAMPDADTVDADAATPHDSDPEPEPPIALDVAVFKATTALADASRRHREPAELAREFVRWAKLLERLPLIASPVSKKRKSRIAELLERTATRLEKTANASGKFSKAKAEKLREALRSTRDTVTDTISAKATPSKPKGKK